MLYEFDTDDVIKGVWLYDRKKTTADFYEQIYGARNKPFIEYLIDWGEIDENSNSGDRDRAGTGEARFRENTAEYVSMHGANSSPHSAEDEIHRGDSFQSNMTLQSTNTIRGRGKDIFVTRDAIKAKDADNGDDAMALTVADDDGNINTVNIKGPKQSSLFDALSTAPQVGFAPQFKNMNVKSAGKVSKLLDISNRDIYQPPPLT
eukprot:CAMPEP_0201577882 /NCGR_PEP_ID=MMETSP0190_2-20130828/24451_1 /ASSEMBLY_ACC=CAM_ASM_000263 /TAXON_ID=37353 /ORGANISM="Rosalina sp." /LENGTH=204 /DNA_ID=CAMNT_0048010395 /DNA_START=1 /DNA_END=615 /DNA_ORIENTATION=-